MATQYLKFVPCCNTTVHYDFQIPNEGAFLTPRLYRYDGTEVYKDALIPDQCYTVTKETGNPEYIDGLSEVDPNDLQIFLPNTTCDNGKCLECPPCFKLYNCSDNEVIYTYSDILANLGDFVTLFDYDQCWYVSYNEGDCLDPVVVDVNSEVPCACAINCYVITGNPTYVTYVDIDNIIHTVTGPGIYCSKIVPHVSGGTGTVTNLGLCVDGVCSSPQCLKFTNCETGEELIATATNAILSNYASNKIVTLNGYEGCWTIDISGNCDCINFTWVIEGISAPITSIGNKIATYNSRNVYEIDLSEILLYLWWDSDDNLWILSEDGYGENAGQIQAKSALDTDCPISDYADWFDFFQVEVVSITKCPASCDCAVDVSVLQAFDDCPSCVPIIAYKFTNCDNSEAIKYSLDDCSAYVGKTVKLDCGGCWTVCQVDFRPPSVQTIVITATYDSCINCSDQFYRLVDCAGIRPTIYTTTDLSSYVSNVVKLTFYPDTCWTVLFSLDGNTSDDLVIVDSKYSSCISCTASNVCYCSTVTNNSGETETFQFRDCDNQLQSIILDPGETSRKHCVLSWIFPTRWILPKLITNYSECVDGACPLDAPFKSVRPGYNSPACSTQYYERIVCAYSEVLYRDVIAQRYGIAPCCLEDELYRLDIKYQLLELQAILNPDYVCTPVSSCCQETDTCNCGCNS